MIIELHMLQNFVPANLNRDDTGSPKECMFGGHRRARVSSQCFKRAIRTEFASAGLLGPEHLSSRTKRAVEAIANGLMSNGAAEADARGVATALLNEIGLKIKEGKTEYLLFLSERELGAAVEVARQHWGELLAAAQAQGQGTRTGTLPPAIRSALLARLDGGRAVDLALFGRMIANLPDKNVEAASQVAHAISTNKVDMEFDFYTAVDDLKPDDTAGADMLGTVEFNASCFYRYANVDTTQLRANLGEDESLARSTLREFLRAAVAAIPTGKQNSMAAHNPPSLVMTVVRGRGQWNLANAFVKPVRPQSDTDLVQGSISALDAYWGKLVGMYGSDSGVAGAWVATTDPERLVNLAAGKRATVAQVIADSVAAVAWKEA